MTRRAALVIGGTLIIGATLAVQTISARPSPDFVAIDAVVVDGTGRTIDDLKPGDFSVREDGRTVAIDSFDEVSATGAGRDRGARTVVVILDDSSLPPSLTPRVQTIAGLFMNRTGVDDRVSVVRANSRTDEAVFGRNQAEMRIAEYRAGSLPFFGRESFEIALTKFAKISRGFADQDPHRRTIVCIGAPAVFGVREPRRLHASLLWPYWVSALQETSRANVSIYVIDPNGLTGRVHVSGNDVVERTGGRGFYNSNDFERAVDQTWREAGHYYLLGYRPARTSRELHDVEVKVNRPGAHVHARRTRG